MAYAPFSILSALERAVLTHVFAAATFGAMVVAALGIAALLQGSPRTAGLKVAAAAS